jgi:hypothetical protein
MLLPNGLAVRPLRAAAAARSNTFRLLLLPRAEHLVGQFVHRLHGVGERHAARLLVVGYSHQAKYAHEKRLQRLWNAGAYR